MVVDVVPEPESSDAVQLHYDRMQKHWYTSRRVGSQLQVGDSTAPEENGLILELRLRLKTIVLTSGAPGTVNQG